MIREHGPKDSVAAKVLLISGCLGILLPSVGFGFFSFEGMMVGGLASMAIAGIFGGSARRSAIGLSIA